MTRSRGYRGKIMVAGVASGFGADQSPGRVGVSPAGARILAGTHFGCSERFGADQESVAAERGDRRASRPPYPGTTQSRVADKLRARSLSLKKSRRKKSDFS